MTKPKTNTRINGKDYYRIRKVIDGKSKTFYGRTKADAEKKYDDYLRERYTDASTRLQIQFVASFSEKASIYITEVLKPSAKYATATKERYSNAYYTHIKGTWLDRMRLSDIRASDIQHFYNELDVSKQTLATVNKFMRAYNKWLILNEYAHDFLSAVDIPRKPENKRHEDVVVWEDDEIKTILENMDGHRLRFLVYVMLYTGARISEAIALKHSDIYDGSIHIERQCYCGEIKEPKYNSKRAIPMHEDLVGAYREHIEWQKADMEKNGYVTDLLFTTSNGTMYDAVDVRRSLRRFYDAHGMPNKTPHTYRATFCTRLCRNGVPIEVASNLMGHKSIEVTAKHYTHIRGDAKDDAIAMLQY